MRIIVTKIEDGLYMVNNTLWKTTREDGLGLSLDLVEAYIWYLMRKPYGR
jgi:hypothetical protein